ncbi:hypothetical protein SPRG_05640 [Saprolegnia parasitica CBS 223.65]|uniref:Uncharacterized protein n=1 Tax=Saprolegnia parasitica (strain CBS 223.65) TaxID=695850 RepID=A0A067CG50_SAPPC|nr:hypothetical protein SPRG_05640 [Saprolegnia parasitica CBS 223.65]KDO29689.1 hypothetical protein SPRG_05640 [Saprolegnia parasitica CBS 223.65]|eukprot:XP_012199746.1 hypothetical protein SPRG_05640 [Saprolegnia parasitica CBS 223.65]
MFRAKVAASPTLGILKLATRRRYTLRHDPCLFVTSLFISVSMIIMPLEAYVSEMLPWTSLAPFNPPFATFAEFNATTLATRNSYVLRRLVCPLNDSSMTDGSTQCLASFLVGLPGVLFYGPAMNDLLSTFAASGDATTSGTCLTVTFLSLPIANECLWLQRGNDLAMTNQSEDFTLTFALTQYPYPWLLWLKFVTRVVSTSKPRHGALTNFTKYASFHDAISGTSYGGLMYALFDWNPRYKAAPTMNLRGADCFLLCYCNDHLASRIRLSLLHALDCNLSDPQLAIRINPRPSLYPANALEITRLASEKGSLDEALQIVLSLPRKPSLWCI